MSEVKRIYPESRSGLINWIEENFHDIDEFVCAFSLKDGTTMAVYDSYTFMSALGLSMVAVDTIQQTAHDGEFVCKQRD